MRDKRAALVGLAVAAAVVGGAPTAVAASPPASLAGHGHGTWQVKPSNPDTGTQRVVHGHGQFTIGAARVRGSVTSPGFIARGDCGVTLRLVTATGALTLVGHSKQQPSSDVHCVGQRVRFHFHETKSSGDLAGTSYKGIGRIDLETQSSDVTDKGTFTLKLATS